jgi:hypothetical protein
VCREQAAHVRNVQIPLRIHGHRFRPADVVGNSSNLFTVLTDHCDAPIVRDAENVASFVPPAQPAAIEAASVEIR